MSIAASASSRSAVSGGGGSDVNPATLKSMAAEVVTLASGAESASQSQLQQQLQRRQQEQRAAAAAASDLQIGSSNAVSSFALSQSSNLSKSAMRRIVVHIFQLGIHVETGWLPIYHLNLQGNNPE